jgi:hypothetical protein
MGESSEELGARVVWAREMRRGKEWACVDAPKGVRDDGFAWTRWGAVLSVRAHGVGEVVAGALGDAGGRGPSSIERERVRRRVG